MRRTSILQSVTALCLLCWVSASCSSSGDPASMAKCRELVAAYCDRAGECHDQQGSLTEKESLELAADCKINGSESEHCETATEISADYDECVGAINNMLCGALVSEYTDQFLRLPSECSGVVRFTP